MKRTVQVLLIGLVSLTLMASVSFAAGNPYASVQIGATWLEDADIDYNDPGFIDDESEFDTGYNIGAAVGYDFGQGRLEAEVAYRQNDFDKINIDGIDFSADGDASALSLMVNGYLDIENQSPFTPYLGAGIGVADISFNDVEVVGVGFADDEDTVFAYQLAAGVGIEVAPALIIDLGYRYFATDDPELDDDLALGGFETEYDSHNVSVGLRMNF